MLRAHKWIKVRLTDCGLEPGRGGRAYGRLPTRCFERASRKRTPLKAYRDPPTSRKIPNTAVSESLNGTRKGWGNNCRVDFALRQLRCQEKRMLRISKIYAGLRLAIGVAMAAQYFFYARDEFSDL
jgi:hypothetical protein